MAIYMFVTNFFFFEGSWCIIVNKKKPGCIVDSVVEKCKARLEYKRIFKNHTYCISQTLTVLCLKLLMHCGFLLPQDCVQIISVL